MKFATLFLEKAKEESNSPIARMVFQAQKNFREEKKREDKVDAYWKIINKADDSAEILIYEQIGKSFWDDSGVGAKQFAEDLKGLSAKGVKNLEVGINSPGGSVFEGLAIYNLLKAFNGNVDTRVDGIAASIASVIAMAGKTVKMPANAMFMIHDPASYAMGTADDMRKQADVLDKVKESLIAVYKAKTGLPEDEIASLMKDETWFTASHAKEKGFANVITDAVEVTARFDLSGFRNAPVIGMGTTNGGTEAVALAMLQVAHTNAAIPEPKTVLKEEPKKEEVNMDLAKLKAEYPGLVTAIADEAKGPLVAEVEGLKGKVTALADENGKLAAENKDLSQKVAIQEEANNKATAEKEMKAVLATSAVPATLHAKVMEKFDFHAHVKDGGLDIEAFKAAFTADVQGWEAGLGKATGTGVSDPKVDGSPSNETFAKAKAEMDEILGVKKG